MPTAVEQRFIFNASAVALGGRIRRPKDQFIKSVASSALPVTGGLAEASVKAPDSQRGLVKYESASTRAFGDFKDPAKAAKFTNGNHAENNLPTVTEVSATLKGLRVEMPIEKPVKGGPKVRSLAVQTLNASLGSSSDRKSQNSFSTLTAEFIGVTIDDKYKLTISTTPEICTKYPTHDRLVTAYQQDPRFQKRYGNQFYPIGREGNATGKDGYIVVTVVNSITWVKEPAPDVTIDGNTLKIKGLGTAYLGELYIDENTRRLSLLRLHLGCPSGGEITACECLGDGQPWPPPGR